MKKLYICSGCDARFEADESLFADPVVRCPACGEEHPRGEYSEVNFCPYCREALQFPLDLPPGQLVTCTQCSGEFRTAGAGPDDAGQGTVLAPDTLFDKFRIIRLLGRGGMGEVYLAEHRLLHRECALKILFQESSDDPEYAARFVQEAKIGNRISHPNLVGVYDVGTDFKTGRLFLAMEYVDGQSLSQLLKQRRFAEPEILQIGIEVCKALEAMAAAGVVHRDIKPANIMMTEEGLVKLMDLGIAKSADRRNGDVTLTQGKEVFGTPEYASPEQCRSAHAADHRSDLYSLGATLYHLVSGMPPYDGGTTLEIVLKVLKDEPEDLHRLAPELSPGLVQLIRDMMRRDPAARPADASVVRARLEALLTGTGKPVPSRKKVRIIGGIAAGFLLLLLAGAGWWQWRAAHPEKPEVCAAAKTETKTEARPEAKNESARKQTLDEILAERLAKCEKNLQAVEAEKTSDPDRKEWNRFRRDFFLKQQALLKQQIENRKLAHAAARKKYSPANTQQVIRIVKQIETATDNNARKALEQTLIRLARDPGTDPNLQIPVDTAERFRSFIGAACKYGRKQVRQILLDRHVLIPDNFFSSDPDLIRYGIPFSHPFSTSKSDNFEILLLAGHTLQKDWVIMASLPSALLQTDDIRPWKVPLLHYIVMKNNRMAVMQLILCGVDVNCPDEQGQTALHWAVKYGRRDLADILLAAGGNPELRDRKGRKYTDCEDLCKLHLALSRKQSATICPLVESTGEANILLDNEFTLLQWLCNCFPGSKSDIIFFLLDHGADPGLVGMRSWFTPLRGVVLWLLTYSSGFRRGGEYTEENADRAMKTLRKLLEMRHQESFSWWKNRQLRSNRCSEHQKRIHAELVKLVAEVEARRQPLGKTLQNSATPESKPVQKQTESGKQQTLDEILTERLAKCEKNLQAVEAEKTNDPNRKEWNRFRRDFFWKQQALLKQQLEKRKQACLEARKQYSRTNAQRVREIILQLKSMPGTADGTEDPQRVQLLQELIRLVRDPGTDPNLRLSDGTDSQVSRRLIEFVHLLSVYGAEKQYWKDIREILLQRYVLIPDDFRSGDPVLIRYGIPHSWPSIDNFEILLLAGHPLQGNLQRFNLSPAMRRDMDIRQPWQIPILHYAVMKGQRSAVMQMLLGGVDINCTDEQGQSALHWAVKYDRRDLIDVLLAAGCNPEIRDRKNRKYTDCEELCKLHHAGIRRDGAAIRAGVLATGEANILLRNDCTLLLQLCCRAPGSQADTIRFLLDHGADPGLIGTATLLLLPARGVKIWMKDYCSGNFSGDDSEFTAGHADQALEILRKLLEMRPQDYRVCLWGTFQPPADASEHQKRVYAEMEQLIRDAKVRWRQWKKTHRNNAAPSASLKEETL